MISESTLQRLETQLEVIPLLLRGAAPEAVLLRSTSGKWSAHENLAHLARHHAIFLERLDRILKQNAPRLDRYRAEDDSAWPEWGSFSIEEVLTRLATLRAEIVHRINSLPEEETNRVGIHPLFGEMSLALWIEFFLLHEAHHLYVVMTRLGEARINLSERGVR